MTAGPIKSKNDHVLYEEGAVSVSIQNKTQSPQNVNLQKGPASTHLIGRFNQITQTSPSSHRGLASPMARDLSSYKPTAELTINFKNEIRHILSQPENKVTDLAAAIGDYLRDLPMLQAFSPTQIQKFQEFVLSNILADPALADKINNPS